MTTAEPGFTRQLYTFAETKHMLSVGETKLKELVREKALNPTKLGRRTLFFASDLAEFLAKLRT